MTEATQAAGMKGTKNMQSEMILNLSTVKYAFWVGVL